jgi:hypothetical protein
MAISIFPIRKQQPNRAGHRCACHKLDYRLDRPRVIAGGAVMAGGEDGGSVAALQGGADAPLVTQVAEAAPELLASIRERRSLGEHERRLLHAQIRLFLAMSR